jgi:hypothetical protein
MAIPPAKKNLISEYSPEAFGVARKMTPAFFSKDLV